MVSYLQASSSVPGELLAAGVPVPDPHDVTQSQAQRAAVHRALCRLGTSLNGQLLSILPSPRKASPCGGGGQRRHKEQRSLPGPPSEGGGGAKRECRFPTTQAWALLWKQLRREAVPAGCPGGPGGEHRFRRRWTAAPRPHRTTPRASWGSPPPSPMSWATAWAWTTTRPGPAAPVQVQPQPRAASWTAPQSE